MRSVSGSISKPESSSAIRAAARIIWVKRSIRRALRCSIHFVGSKSFNSQAKWTANSDGSKASIGRRPLARDEVLPERLDVVAERGHGAHAGDHDPPVSIDRSHRLVPLRVIQPRH